MSKVDAHFDETRRLMRAISALSATPDVMAKEGRPLSFEATESGDTIEAILNEINETVLRRVLSFTAGDGQGTLKIEVFERRILSCHAMPAVLSDKYSKIKGRPLAAQDAAQCFSMLSEFAGALAVCRVSTELPAKTPEQAFDGVACSDLIRLRTLKMSDDSNEASIDHALEITREKSQACLIMRGGDGANFSGQPAFEAGLIEILNSFKVLHESPEVRLWALDPADNTVVVVVAAAEVCLVAICANPDAFTLFHLWHNAIQVSAS